MDLSRSIAGAPYEITKTKGRSKSQNAQILASNSTQKERNVACAHRQHLLLVLNWKLFKMLPVCQFCFFLSAIQHIHIFTFKSTRAIDSNYTTPSPLILSCFHPAPSSLPTMTPLLCLCRRLTIDIPENDFWHGWLFWKQSPPICNLPLKVR